MALKQVEGVSLLVLRFCGDSHRPSLPGPDKRSASSKLQKNNSINNDYINSHLPKTKYYGYVRRKLLIQGGPN